MTARLIELRDVSKHYLMTRGSILRRAAGWLPAVDHVNLALDAGETLGLVGESGCGKTTTAKLILRLEAPTSGEILFEGTNVAHLDRNGIRQYRRSIQAVFQDPWSSMNPRLRVRSIIAEPLIVSGSASRSEVRSRVAQLLDAVGLRPEHADLFPHQFSGGQRQRIAVARALSIDPRLIVLDEPVSSLDVSIRAQILNMLKDLQVQRGLSYLLISHDLGSLRFLADRIGVMYLGRIVELGPTRDVYQAPRHPYTRALYAAAAADTVSIRSAISGEDVPSALNLPSGCRFRTRCPYAMPVCAVEDPPLREVGENHAVACHLY